MKGDPPVAARTHLGETKTVLNWSLLARGPLLATLLLPLASDEQC